MANVLKMAKIQSILTLYERGWSRRRIARELNINRETVGKYIQQAAKPAANPRTGSADSKPATSDHLPTGSDAGQTGQEMASSAGQAPPGRACGPVSKCERYREFIESRVDQGLSAQRIWQDLDETYGPAKADTASSSDTTATDEDFPGYDSVQRFVRRLRQHHDGQPLPYRRIEREPGLEAQIDFGSGAPVVDANGKRRRTHVLRVVLSHSRKGYSEAVFSQTTENFIRCIENAIHHFGGAPRTLVIDNLRAAVSKADWFDPEINPKVQSFCEHYGMVVLPTKPRMPRHKGKVERGVDYVQENALKARTFDSLEQQNAHLRQWESSVADTRIHGTTKKQVAKVFHEVERAALKPLPIERFAFFHEGQRTVNRDGHIEVDKAYYSAPPEYLGRRVWVRWDSRMVRLFNSHMEQIAVHVRHEPGRFSTDAQHIHSRKISQVERGSAWLLQKASTIGPNAQRWSEAMLENRGIQGVRVLQGLISLQTKHDIADLERVCGVAHAHGAFRLRTIRQLLKRDTAAEQQTFEFIDEHPIIRSLADYGQLVHQTFQQETASCPLHSTTL